MEFIEPDRSNYIVSAHKPGDDGVLDLGFAKGAFSDGRPYKIECWCMEEFVMATVLFDEALITAWKRADFALLLELEELFKFNGRPLVQAARMKDDAGRGIWAVNVMVKNDKGLQAEILRPLQRYIQFERKVKRVFSKRLLRTTPYGVKAIRTAGSTAA